MKLGALAQPSFVLSFRKLMQQKLPVKSSFRLRGIAKFVNDELVKFNETKEHLVLEYGLKDEAGRVVQDTLPDGQVSFKLDPTRQLEFAKKMRELENIEVDVPTVTIDDLGGEDRVDLTADDFFNLAFIQE